ncbi:MAG: asparagine synthase-related protein, partial [Planctomycetes bacterium]|nr:asparagine synthase-related protein [Planctomycetota bacterium]
MMRALDKHGPDGNANWHSDSIAFGHQAMHITPESKHERLPLHHAPSGIALTCEARLDNRDDLMRALGTPTAPTPSDAELILAAYLKWGTSCAERLIGEFAIAIWDAREQRLHCLTDPMGVRPLYYVSAAEKFVAFASEIEALLGILERPEIDERRLAMLGLSAMTFFLEPQRTPFRQIRRVPAATVMTFDTAGITQREYWRPDPEKRLTFTSDEACAEAFQDVFSAAVAPRLRTAEPPTALLSGGLDSSAIVGMASHIGVGTNQALSTLSIVPEPSAQGLVADERDWIDLFRGQADLHMTEVSANGAGPFDHQEGLVRSGSLCTYGFQHFMYTALARAARQNGSRVLLDGYGGELSASVYTEGYPAELALHGRFRQMIHELRHLNPERRISARAIKTQVLRPFVPLGLLKWRNRNKWQDRAPSYPLRPEYLNDVLGPDTADIRDRIARLRLTAPDHRKNMARRILLARQDARQRSHAGFIGYETVSFTYPYLDRRVMEFSLAVDGRFKRLDGQSRRLIRLGTKGLIPDEVRKRTSKAPFCPDYHLRYSRQKDRARELFRGMASAPGIAQIIDFGAVFSKLAQYDYDGW